MEDADLDFALKQGLLAGGRLIGATFEKHAKEHEPAKKPTARSDVHDLSPHRDHTLQTKTEMAKTREKVLISPTRYPFHFSVRKLS